MDEKSFGNLKEWGGVLEKMEKLALSGKLGNHQDELIRVLRYNDNWRLREAALSALPKIQTPSPALIDEALAIMMRDDLYYDVRILAADALGKTLKKNSKGDWWGSDKTKEIIGRVLDGMSRLLKAPQPPILHKVVKTSLERIINGEHPLYVADPVTRPKEIML
jgi:HEAT repeat protein